MLNRNWPNGNLGKIIPSPPKWKKEQEQNNNKKQATFSPVTSTTQTPLPPKPNQLKKTEGARMSIST